MKPEAGVLGDASNEVVAAGRHSQSQLNFRVQKLTSGSRKGSLHFSAAAQQSLGQPFKPVKPNLPKISEQPPPAPKTRGQQHEPAPALVQSAADAEGSIRAKDATEQGVSSRQPSKTGSSCKRESPRAAGVWSRRFTSVVRDIKAHSQSPAVSSDPCIAGAICQVGEKRPRHAGITAQQQPSKRAHVSLTHTAEPAGQAPEGAVAAEPTAQQGNMQQSVQPRAQIHEDVPRAKQAAEQAAAGSSHVPSGISVESTGPAGSGRAQISDVTISKTSSHDLASNAVRAVPSVEVCAHDGSTNIAAGTKMAASHDRHDARASAAAEHVRLQQSGANSHHILGMATPRGLVRPDVHTPAAAQATPPRIPVPDEVEEDYVPATPLSAAAASARKELGKGAEASLLKSTLQRAAFAAKNSDPQQHMPQAAPTHELHLTSGPQDLSPQSSAGTVGGNPLAGASIPLPTLRSPRQARVAGAVSPVLHSSVKETPLRGTDMARGMRSPDRQRMALAMHTTPASKGAAANREPQQRQSMAFLTSLADPQQPRTAGLATLPSSQDLKPNKHHQHGMGEQQIELDTKGTSGALASAKPLPLSASLLLPQPQQSWPARSDIAPSLPNALAALPHLPVIADAPFQLQNLQIIQSAIPENPGIALLPLPGNRAHPLADPSSRSRLVLPPMPSPLAARHLSDACQQPDAGGPDPVRMFATSPGIFGDDNGGPCTPDAFAALMQDLTGFSAQAPATFARPVPSMKQGTSGIQPQIALPDVQWQVLDWPKPAISQPSGTTQPISGSGAALDPWAARITNQQVQFHAEQPSSVPQPSLLTSLAMPAADQPVRPLHPGLPATDRSLHQQDITADPSPRQHVQPPIETSSAGALTKQQQEQQPNSAGTVPPAAGVWSTINARQGMALQHQQDLSKNANSPSWGVFGNATTPGSTVHLHTTAALPLPAGQLVSLQGAMTGPEEDSCDDAPAPQPRADMQQSIAVPLAAANSRPAEAPEQRDQDEPILRSDQLSAGARLDTYLPDEIVDVVQAAGIKSNLYNWQAEALNKPGVLTGRNLVFCAPTSSGKSIVADILMLRRLHATRRTALYVLPYVALCSERVAKLKKYMAPLGREVLGNNAVPSPSAVPLDCGAIVCTIEKANTLINRMIEEGKLNLLGSIVVDELHMIGDEDRGYQIELLLTKLRFATDAAGSQLSPNEGLQIIGMSATMPNGDQLANWLKAEFLQTDFRPVPLTQHILVGNKLLDEKQQPVRQLDVGSSDGARQDRSLLAQLCRETVQDGHSVLIFCGTKWACVQTAREIADKVKVPERSITNSMGGTPADRDTFAAELRQLPGGIAAAIADLVAKGVAYHNSDLQAEEREIIESAYRAGAISVIAATSTLAAGVNLPARRVIFRHAWVGRENQMLDSTKYQQMAGRAGRAGLDTQGEAIIMANPSTATLLSKLMQAGSREITSCLRDTSKGMKRALLEAVATGAVASGGDVKRFKECTLLQATVGDEVADSSTKEALRWLCHKHRGFIAWSNDLKQYSATDFGKATMASSLSPEQALLVKQDLATAADCFVMNTELHLCFIITPIKRDFLVDWQLFYDLHTHLPANEQKVCRLAGLKEKFLMDRYRNGPLRQKPGVALSDKLLEQERIAKRLFGAMILNDLLQEVPQEECVRKYKVPGPAVHVLQEEAARFCGMVAAFCERLGWVGLEAIITKFQGRVSYGVKPEIVSLTEIPHVKGHRARLMYKAGLRTPEAVAAVEPEALIAILGQGLAGGNRGKASKARDEKRAAFQILRAAKDLLRTRAQDARREARARAAQIKALTERDRTAQKAAEGSPGAVGTASSPPDQTAVSVLSPQAGLKANLQSAAPPAPAAHQPPSPARLLPEALPTEGLVLVDTLNTCKEFCKLWHEMSSWGFSLDYTAADTRASKQLEMPRVGPASTTGSDGSGSRLRGLAVTWDRTLVFYVKLASECAQELWGLVASVLEKAGPEKVTYDLKHQLAAILPTGISCPSADIANPVVDVRIACWLHRPDAVHVCDSVPLHISRKNLPRSLEGLLQGAGAPPSVLANAASLLKSCRHPGISQQARSVCRTAILSFGLHQHIQPLLETEGLLGPLRNIEMPLVRVLAAMEDAGIAIDVAVLRSVRAPLDRYIKALQTQAVKLAGITFSLDSPKEVSQILFERLKLPVPPNSDALKGGLPSTKSEVLQELQGQHQIAGVILEHRTASKLRNSFLAELERIVAASSKGSSSSGADAGQLVRIRGNILQTSSATGRLAMDEPNLQTVPKAREFLVPCTQISQESQEPASRAFLANIRAAFVAPPGYVLLSADYAQLELRLMAHFSEDASLCQLLCDPSHDPFFHLAVRWLQLRPEQVLPEHRNQAKALAYGVLYGMGHARLADGLKCSLAEAKEHQEAFMRALPGLEAWVKVVVEDCKKSPQLCVQTLGCRRRYLPAIRSSGKGGDHAAAAAKRQAVNTVPQGSAADLVKLVMIRLAQQLPERFPNNGCRLLLQIHDELLFEVHRDALQSAARFIRDQMEDILSLKVPLKVRFNAGPSWGEMGTLSADDCI
ncbi:hypothetical protein WJX74_002208 [Apatococcus lobatus]|uniref:DNA-directed DNA polymerase n=2 Tax=Apatococcus lobatus TaxID=904363 RepID=A0AAW1RPH6_9CHLO